MSDGHLVKAQIVPVENGIEQTPIVFMFNPREYSVSRSVDWGNAPNDSKEAGDKVYKGGSPAQLNLELFFDTYGQRSGKTTVEDVRKYTDRLWALTRINDQLKDLGANPNVQKGRPPRVLFQWGSTWHFTAVLKTMEVGYTLFTPDGMPVRATVKVSLEQADYATFQHQGGLSTYNVSQGIRSAAGQRGFVGDLRLTALGKGGKS